ncbi:MAG: hypothetical protein IPO01_11470 [Chitinophagaceae bacterium]|nr:hypothetical protein [Chitinophagaceae bacterium]
MQLQYHFAAVLILLSGITINQVNARTPTTNVLSVSTEFSMGLEWSIHPRFTPTANFPINTSWI